MQIIAAHQVIIPYHHLGITINFMVCSDNSSTLLFTHNSQVAYIHRQTGAAYIHRPSGNL